MSEPKVYDAAVAHGVATEEGRLAFAAMKDNGDARWKQLVLRHILAIEAAQPSQPVLREALIVALETWEQDVTHPPTEAVLRYVVFGGTAIRMADAILADPAVRAALAHPTSNPEQPPTLNPNDRSDQSLLRAAVELCDQRVHDSWGGNGVGEFYTFRAADWNRVLAVARGHLSESALRELTTARAALSHPTSSPELGSEYGWLLAERDRLIGDGVDPADLDLPIPPTSRPEDKKP